MTAATSNLGIAAAVLRSAHPKETKSARPPNNVTRDPNSFTQNPDLWLYRDRTLSLLRRYSRLERILERLGGFERTLIGKIVLQNYTQHEAAMQLGCWRRTVGRRYSEALDQLSEMFLESGMLNRLPGHGCGTGETLSRG